VVARGGGGWAGGFLFVLLGGGGGGVFFFFFFFAKDAFILENSASVHWSAVTGAGMEVETLTVIWRGPVGLSTDAPFFAANAAC